MALLDSNAPAAKFPTVGTRVGGKVTRDAYERQQTDFDSGAPQYWTEEPGKKSTDAFGPNGEKRNPCMQLVVPVQGDYIDPTIDFDDGERSIYIAGQMLAATKAACRKVRARSIEAGGEFWVTYVRDEPLPKGKRGFPQKIYEVTYVPPTGDDDEDDTSSLVPAKDPHQAGVRQAVAATTARKAAAKAAQDDEPPF